MTETNGLTTEELLALIAETNKRIDRNYEEHKRIHRILAENQLALSSLVDRQEKRTVDLAEIQRDTLLLLNRQDDRLNRLERR